MALTMAQFIDRAQRGAPIALYSSTISPTNDIIIAGQPITIVESNFELGNYFTAQQVLESYPLRGGLVGGTILATIGYVSLSLTPVI
jgi:hypothetical protein